MTTATAAVMPPGHGRHRSTVGAEARGLLLTGARERRSEFRGLAGWSVLEAVPTLLSGLVVARAIDDGFLIGRPGIGLFWLAVLGISVLVGSWGTRHTLARLAAVVEPFRDDLVRRVVRAAVRRPTPVGDADQGGDVARLTQHVEIVREAYAAVLMVGQRFLVIVLSTTVGLVVLDPGLLALVLPPVALALVLFACTLRGMARGQRDSILADERLSDSSAALGVGMRDVVVCGGEDLICKDVGRHIASQAAATVGLGRRTALATAVVALGGWLPVLLLLATGPALVARGATAGVILGAVAYTLQGLQPALQTFADGLSGPGLWLMVTTGRLVETTKAETTAETTSSQPADGHHGAGSDLVLEDVSFGYSPWAAPVVRRLDLTIPAGDHLAVVGPSGIGKSTLAGLLTGLLTPASGRVLIAGADLTSWPNAELAHLRVLIPQEAYVFAGSVRDNLEYLALGVADAQLAVAVDRLGARRLVERLGGYDAVLDPTELSSGEQQLITLVRAYLSPAPVVVLDEATCHLDPAAEARVERAFAGRSGTLVVIAHRMSSALRARRILVMDGSQARLGDHEDLLLNSALYRDLVGHWNGSGQRVVAVRTQSPHNPASGTG